MSSAIFEAIQQINETRMGNLYHGTDLYKAQEILKSDTLVARMPIHTTDIPAKFKGETKTVSFSRSLTVAKKFASSDYPQFPGVIFVIDQAALHRKVGRRLQPYSDVDTPWHRQQMARWGDPFGHSSQSGRSVDKTEAEEIVFGDIKGINSLIKKIYVMLSSGDNLDMQMETFRNSSLAHDPRVILSDGFHHAKYPDLQNPYWIKSRAMTAREIERGLSSEPELFKRNQNEHTTKIY